MNTVSRLLAVVGLIVTCEAHAAEMPRFNKISGELAESFEGLHHFSLNNFDQVTCTLTLDQATFKAWDCTDSQPTITTLSNEKPTSLSLKLQKSYKVFRIRDLDQKWNWQFRYLGMMGNEFKDHGIPEGTQTTLTWTVSEEKLDSITAIWELPDLRISRTFYATPE